jgi:hypothetical protein
LSGNGQNNVQKKCKKKLTLVSQSVKLASHTVRKRTTNTKMKTKTLLIAAAALAAGIMSSQAQVYSQNVVGYVNLSISNGFNCINIPLDYDGTGTNNVVNTIIGTNLPNGTIIESWSPSSGFSANAFGPTSKAPTPHWANATVTYNPGEGIFVYNPSNYVVNLTIVGTVLQGGLTNSYLSTAGFSLVGSQFPVAGGITSTYGYTPSDGDIVETWTPAGGFSANAYGPTSKEPTPHWAGGEPTLAVGEGAFLYTTNTSPVWGTNFMVQ